MIEKVAVFCGSNNGNKQAYVHGAKLLGMALLKRNITLVYGGATVGLMKVLANEFFKENGKLIGIMPEFLQRKNIFQKGLTESVTVQSMSERKEKMESLSDGFIAMPGGYGTLDEISEMMVLQQMGHFNKPIGIYNIEGYFDHFMSYIEHMVDNKFLQPESFKDLIISENANELLDKMISYK